MQSLLLSRKFSLLLCLQHRLCQPRPNHLLNLREPI